MDSINNYNLRFPIGEFVKSEIISSEIIKNWINTLRHFPNLLIKEVEHLSDEELDWCYRPNGWNIRQVVNHCADSNINSFMRFKLALTEDKPTIRPYFEDRWAELEDTTKTPVEFSLKIIEGIHARWVVLLNSSSEKDLLKTFIHPEGNIEISLAENIGIYDWHCRHHLEHVCQAKKIEGKFK